MRSKRVLLLSAVTSVALLLYLCIRLFKVDTIPYVEKIKSEYLRDEIEVDNELLRLQQEPKRGEENIMFIETRCTLNTTTVSNPGLDLNKRQACSIESAAKANPNATVYILYSCPINGKITDSLSYVQQIFTYSNVKIWKIDIPDFLKDTILKEWDFKTHISSSKWPVEHSSDVLRFVSLWKYGGTYLDLDVIVRKPIKELGSNYVMKEDEKTIAACVLNFDVNEVGRTVSDMCVEEIYFNFDGSAWTANGPALITRVMVKYCLLEEVRDMETEKCHGVKILPSDRFTPIHYSGWMDILSEAKEEILTKMESSYGVHLWNSLSKKTLTNVLVHTPLRTLAEDFCPQVQLHSGMNF